TIMQNRNRSSSRKTKTFRSQGKPVVRVGRASAHSALANDLVHIFVDDQNLFFGIINNRYGSGFRIDFGRLLLGLAQATDGRTRAIGSAYIAGVIPDDDSFWEVARS